MEAKDTRIYMIVDTEKIRSGKEEECVEFKDDRKNPNPHNDPRKFNSVINPRKKVFWYGEPKARPQDTVDIVDIERKGANDPDFLKTKGNDPSRRGAYMGQVIDEGKDGEVSSYNVIFEIKDKKGQYRVDPKLTMEIPKSQE
ncbi:hypothetical protein HC174_08220 [Salinimicrobium sp. CDJ15-81-2]|nr:hypothetical protein [Salinimicrobium nanhaiense]